jgi:hypothetical protein
MALITVAPVVMAVLGVEVVVRLELLEQEHRAKVMLAVMVH